MYFLHSFQVELFMCICLLYTLLSYYYYYADMQQIKSISDAGVNVIVSGGKVGDLAQHYCNKYKVMVVRLLSKWDVRRLCKSLQATALPKIVSDDGVDSECVLGCCDNA